MEQFLLRCDLSCPPEGRWSVCHNFQKKVEKFQALNVTRLYTRYSLNIVFFPYNFVIFLNSASSSAALVFDLQLCTLAETEGKPRETRIYFKIFEKTQYLMDTLYHI